MDKITKNLIETVNQIVNNKQQLNEAAPPQTNQSPTFDNSNWVNLNRSDFK